MSINMQNLSFTYFGSTGPALHDLTVAVAPGEVWGVLGRSGAGKSTLALLLSGFMPQFFNGEAAGSARIGQYDLLLLSPGELSGTVALVLSDPFGQISGTRFTVFEEVAFGLENLGLPPSDIRERCQWALDTVGIAALADRSPYSLSGGQQQRLVLAAALAMRPQVLILDQPAAQLDPRTVLELGDTLRSLAAGGTTIVVAEARVPWLARLADRVLLLHEGSARLHGPAEAVLHDPLLGELGITPSGAQETLGLAGLPAATAQEAQPLIALEGVGFRYEGGVEALREVSLTIRRGERVALLGRNGAGKSTLLRHLNGLLRPTAGRVLVAGNDTRQRTVAQCARTAALSFQDVRNQLFAGSVREELAFGPRNLGYEPARVAALVAQALATTGLESVAGEHPYDLSPQQRRLVAIGATLAMDTPLLVLDEPGAGMDDAGLLLLEQIIARRASEGASVLVVSHDVRFSARVSERVLLLAEGRLAVDSPWHDLDDAERALLDAEVGLPVAHNA